MKDSRSLRWWGVVTLFVIVAISYVDRINISVLITDHDFLSHIGLTPTTERVRACWPRPSWSATVFRPLCSRRSARRCSACAAACLPACCCGVW
jgi:hypothetical protein